jgi:transcriptional regulator with XRE-family HTH domain
MNMHGDKDYLARAMRRRRADLDLTQAAAAERCQLSASTYAAIERAEREVRDSTLRAISIGLGFDAAATYWNGAPAEQQLGTVRLRGVIDEIIRTERPDERFHTSYRIVAEGGHWQAELERDYPPGPMRVGDVIDWELTWVSSNESE